MVAEASFSRMMKLINATDNLYLTPEQQKQLLDYTNSLPRRLKAARAVEAQEAAIVERCHARVRDRYPEFERYHRHGWDKSFRDVQLVLRYNVQGMLMDDPAVPEDKLLGWFRTLIAGLDMTPAIFRDTFSALQDACREVLPADAYALLEPFLERTTAYLSDFPEPAFAAV
jgi:hypothetical protein